MTSSTEQERAEFEAWLRVKPCGAAHDFAWEAWRARAALAATQPAAQGMDSAISESVLEAVKAINRGNGDGRAYRAALGWIVAHLNQAVARSLAVDPSGKVALPLATALAAQAKQGGDINA